MSMKIKTALDMQGNGIENFLIQGVSAIEGLSDKSLGRKILYTGTNTERNYREMIYIGNSIGGDGWRTTAYMSDVDELRGLITALENATDEEIEALKGRATTTEGNLATLRSEFDALNKALNDDTAGTIDTWNEIQNFVGKYDGSEDLETILSRMNAEIDGKLDLSGGTINGTDAIPLTLDTTATLQIGVRFSMNGVSKSFMGYNPADTYGTHMYNAASSNRIGILDNGTPYYGVGASAYTLLHADNFATQIGDYYLKTTGGTIDGNLQIGTNDNTQFNHLTIVRSGKAIRLNGYGTGMGLSFGSFSSGGTFTQEYQIAMSNYGLQYKESDKTYTILHTGNYSDLISVLNSNLTVKGQLKIDNANPSIQFANGNVTYGRLAWNANYGLVMTDSSWNKEYILLRNDNYSNLITTLNENVTFNAELIGKKETGGSFARWRIATSENGTFFQAGSVDSTKAQGVLYLSGINGTYLEKLNILSDLAVVSNRLHIGHIANDDGSALQINGDIHVTGNIIADGEVSAGGAGTEGAGGAGGFSLYESWGTSAPTEPLALGANLGYELKTRVEDLELAKTKVTFEPALVSGKQIGAITIDGNKANLFAPATYAWSEITGTENVLTTAGGVIDGGDTNVPLKLNVNYSSSLLVFSINNTSKMYVGYSAEYGSVLFDYAHGYRLGITLQGKPAFNNDLLLHQGNYVDLIGDTYLKTTGGTIEKNANAPLVISRISGTISTIGFYGNVSESGGYDLLGMLGFNGKDNPVYRTSGGISQTLLHSGNVGEYKAGGIVTFDSRNKNYAPYSNEFSKKALTVHFERALSVGYGESDYNVNILHISPWVSNTAGAEHQLAFRHDGAIGYRYGSTIWSNWKTLAFTDSNVESAKYMATLYSDGSNWYTNKYRLYGQYDSVDGQTLELKTEGGYKVRTDIATKLADNTAYTIWGQTFFENGKPRNVSGNFILGYNKIYLAKGNENYFIGWNSSSELVANNFYGYKFRTNGIDRLILNSSGNVLIGTTTDNGLSLQVAGSASISSIVLIGGAEYEGGVQFKVKGLSKLETLYTSGNVYNYSSDKASRLTTAWADDIVRIYPSNSEGNVSRDMYLGQYNGGSLNLLGNGRVLVGATTDDGSTRFQVHATSAFYGSTTFGKEGVSMQVNFKCPVVAEDRVTIGGATLRWDDEIKALRLNTSLAATGELSAGGAGTEGGNTGGGGTGTIASPFSRTFTPNEKTSFTFSHDLPYYDVVVQVYEWDSSGMCWNMVLADIEIQNNDVTVTLGRKENVEHKIVVR